MPLTVNVGLTRKHSANFQSQGISINLTAELDPALLANPQRLQDEIAGIYRQAESALARQGERITAPTNPSIAPHTNKPDLLDTQHDANQRLRGITNSQGRALRRIADRLNLDINAECLVETGKAIGDLNIREASRMIDLLRAREGSSGQVEPSTERSQSPQASPAF